MNPKKDKYKQFIILDRDGTLIVERNYLASPDGVELLHNAAAGLRRFEESHWGRLIVTNQSGIGRGYFSGQDLDGIHARMISLLDQSGAHIDDIYVCPHTPMDNCACRKPKTGLVLEAAAAWGFKPSDCVFIGDKSCDVELGRLLGASTILVLTGYGKQQYESGLVCADFVAADLVEAAEIVEREIRPKEGNRRGGNDSTQTIQARHSRVSKEAMNLW